MEQREQGGPPNPELIMRYATGHWASQILSSAVHFEVFTHLDDGPTDAGALALRADISQRGAQALLDGVLGLGLVTLTDGKYANTIDSSTFLVKGKRTYLGFAGIAEFDWKSWENLNAAVKRGTTPRETPTYEEEEYAFWEKLVLAIAPLAHPAAEDAAAHLGIASRDAFHMLDVGGGSGAYSATWLSQNPGARATQFDWHNVNHIAEHYVDRFGVLDRFEMQDGNLLEADFGEDRYDYVIYSHIAHGLSAEQNQQVLGRIRKALKPGGVVVIADFVLENDRQGHPMALLFYSNMLHATEAGQTYTRGDYQKWLAGAGFPEVEVQSLAPQPVTLVYGR